MMLGDLLMILLNRFLQTAESSVRLSENHAAYEQGLTTVSCLLSGLHVFQPSYPDQDRLHRVLQGFHGLHTFASEYWVQYLLSIAASGGLNTTSVFFARSIQLATALNSLYQIGDPAKNIDTSDARLTHLQGHSTLLDAASNILSAQATRQASLTNSESGFSPANHP